MKDFLEQLLENGGCLEYGDCCDCVFYQPDKEETCKLEEKFGKADSWFFREEEIEYIKQLIEELS